MTRWWWIAYTDDSRPVGQRALGCIVTQAETFDQAVDNSRMSKVRRLPIAPGGEPMGGPLPESWGHPPSGYEDRLLQTAEAEALAKAWDPSGAGLAGPDDITRAFEDDTAEVGEPLFDPRRNPFERPTRRPKAEP